MMKAIIGLAILSLSFTAATSDAILDFEKNIEASNEATIYEEAGMPKMAEIDSPTERINYLVRNTKLDEDFLRDLRRKDPKIYCAAVNAYYEARGEPPAGKAAIVEVVDNRTKASDYPNSHCGVIKDYDYRGGKKICQFSWFCNRGEVKSPITPRSTANQKKEWHDSVVATIAVMSGKVHGLVGKSTHFYNHRQVSPPWARRAKNKYVISNHTFVHIK